MAVLADLLLKNRKFSPTYHPNILANHLSMTLIALNKLGASDKQLKLYYEHYLSKLEPISISSHPITINDKNWINYLGCNDYYLNYLDYFQKNIQSNGIDDTLKNFLPQLVPGLSGQAFHCLIRLAYALQIKDADEIAVSLAYFASHFLFLGNKENIAPLLAHPGDVLNKINQTPLLSGTIITGANITERFKKVAVVPEFLTIIAWLKIDNTTLAQSAAILIRLYAATNDFTALHMVTATHAMRLLLPYFINVVDALSYYWQAICAAYISIGAPAIPQKSQLTNQFFHEKITWVTVLEKAIQASDEHVIKLVYTCYEEHKIYRNPLYLCAAANKVKLV